jgi:hypothetical protein
LSGPTAAGNLSVAEVARQMGWQLTDADRGFGGGEGGLRALGDHRALEAKR